MADIHIHREHRLGLPRARKVAAEWAQQAEQRLGLQCSVAEDHGGDTVDFRRSGVTGTLRVAADHFALDAKLGFLLGPFKSTIEREIEQNLEQLLAAPVAAKAARAPAKKPAARRKK